MGVMDERRLAEIEARPRGDLHASSVCAGADLWICEADELVAEIRRLRSALAYYADDAIWAFGSGVREGQPVDLSPVVVRDDSGDRARAALNGDDA